MNFKLGSGRLPDRHARRTARPRPRRKAVRILLLKKKLYEAAQTHARFWRKKNRLMYVDYFVAGWSTAVCDEFISFWPANTGLFLFLRENRSTNFFKCIPGLGQWHAVQESSWGRAMEARKEGRPSLVGSYADPHVLFLLSLLLANKKSKKESQKSKKIGNNADVSIRGDVVHSPNGRGRSDCADVGAGLPMSASRR